MRTALTLFGAGLTFIKFFAEAPVVAVGWAFVPLGVATFAVGLLRYLHISARVKKSKSVREHA